MKTFFAAFAGIVYATAAFSDLSLQVEQIAQDEPVAVYSVAVEADQGSVPSGVVWLFASDAGGAIWVQPEVTQNLAVSDSFSRTWHVELTSRYPLTVFLAKGEDGDAAADIRNRVNAGKGNVSDVRFSRVSNRCTVTRDSVTCE